MIKSKDHSKIMIVKEDSEKYNILTNGNEPYFYKDPNGYYISRWKAGKSIKILQCKGLTDTTIAVEYEYNEE